MYRAGAWGSELRTELGSGVLVVAGGDSEIVIWIVGVFVVVAILDACASMAMLCVQDQNTWICLFADLELHGESVNGPIIAGRKRFS